MTCVSGKAYVGGRFLDLTVYFDEIIERVSLVEEPGCEEAYIILPGFVDLHVHMRGLNQRHKGDWSSESLAALHGGVTLVVDMPNNDPPIDDYGPLELKYREASRESYVDFLFYTLSPFLPRDPVVVGVKVFPDQLYDLDPFKKARELDREVVVHAEDPEILSLSERAERPEDHWRTHPDEAELLATRKVVEMSSRVGNRLRIAHASLPDTVLLGKAGGAKVEVTPHHLFFSRESVRGPLAKVNPPLRDRASSSKLREMAFNGMVDFLVTDHAPHSKEEKSRRYEEMPPGIPWLDVMAPFLLTKIREGAPVLLIDMYSSSPASHLKVNRGAILPGRLADLVLVSKEEWVVSDKELYTRAGDSLLMGKLLPYRVKKVFLRGELVFHEGPVEGPKGKPSPTSEWSAPSY